MRTIIFALALFFVPQLHAITLEKEIDVLVETAEQYRKYAHYTKQPVDWTEYERIVQGIHARTTFLRERKQEGVTRYLLVNRSQYVLRIIENDKVKVEEKVIVGRPSRPTPIFEGQYSVQNIVVNPFWNVPYNGKTHWDVVTKIAKMETWEEQMEYVSMKGYRFFGPSGELDPMLIDFNDFPAGVKIRQEPGDLNSLGRIKFLFPNPHTTYLHDTPSKNLFNKHRRQFSSGCIRVQNPNNLAIYLLNMSGEEVQEMIDDTNNRDRWIKVPNPIPVFVIDGPGWDVWVNADGIVQFK